MSNEKIEEEQITNSINDENNNNNVLEKVNIDEIQNEEKNDINKEKDNITNEEENLPNQEQSLKTSPLIVKKNKKKRNIENLRPFRNSYRPGFENTILEDPENDTIIEYEDINLKLIEKIKNKFKTGTLYHTMLILFINSPVIIVLYVVYIFANSLFCGIIGLILVFIFSIYTSNIILKLNIETSNDKIQNILKINIKNCVYYIYLISDFFYNFGIGFINCNIAFNFIETFNQNIFQQKDYNVYKNYIQSGIVLFFQLLISITKKNLKNIINLCLIILFQILFIFIMIKYENNVKSIDVIFFDEIQLFFIFFPILFLCMSNHNIILDECKNMKIFTLNRGKKVVKMTIISQFILYFVNGILLSFKVKDYNLNNKNPIVWLIGEKPLEREFFYNIFITIIILIFIFCSFNSSIYLKIAINNNIIEDDIKEKIIFYFLIIIYNVLNCLLYNNNVKSLLFIISITSFFSLMVCYIIPLYTYLNIHKSISKSNLIINIIIIICFLLLGFFQFIFLIFSKDLIKENKY